MRICSAFHEILVDKAFTATDSLISQSFVVAFIYFTYIQIALIWGILAQLSLWKLVHWLWRYKLNEVCDIFKELKERFTKEPVLAALNLDKKIRIEFDMSDYATEEVLSIECKDRKWQPVAFLSKSLNETERNYEIHDKKMLAVIKKLEN